MDVKFHSAMAAISDGDVEKFKALIVEDPGPTMAATPNFATSCVSPSLLL